MLLYNLVIPLLTAWLIAIKTDFINIKIEYFCKKPLKIQKIMNLVVYFALKSKVKFGK